MFPSLNHLTLREFSLYSSRPKVFQPKMKLEILFAGFPNRCGSSSGPRMGHSFTGYLMTLTIIKVTDGLNIYTLTRCMVKRFLRFITNVLGCSSRASQIRQNKKRDTRRS